MLHFMVTLLKKFFVRLVLPMARS